MKLDNKINMGNVIAICIFVASIVFAGGQLMANLETLQERADLALAQAKDNRQSINDIDGRLIVIETKLDAGFDNIIDALGSLK